MWSHMSRAPANRKAVRPVVSFRVVFFNILQNSVGHMIFFFKLGQSLESETQPMGISEDPETAREAK